MQMEVLALAAGLSRGESRGGQVCPECGGGRHKDKSFSVSHSLDGTILYMCHRATCGYRGRIRTHLEVVNPVNTSTRRTKIVQAPGPRHPVIDNTKLMDIYDLYGIREETLDWWGVEQYEDQVCIPTRSGWEYRYLPPYPSGVPKTSTYRETDGPWIMDTFGWSPKTPCVLVEDAWSCMKVHQELDWNCVSLMGSHISDDLALLLATEYPTSTVYLCLDKDATEKAVKFVNKYRLLFNDLRFVPLQRDLKYLNGEELKQLFGV